MKQENGKQPFEFITNVDEEMHLFNQCKVGWSEKHKSWKMQKNRADSEPRHSTNFRTIFGILIG